MFTVVLVIVDDRQGARAGFGGQRTAPNEDDVVVIVVVMIVIIEVDYINGVIHPEATTKKSALSFATRKGDAAVIFAIFSGGETPNEIRSCSDENISPDVRSGAHRGK